jgi:hypothetical protein
MTTSSPTENPILLNTLLSSTGKQSPASIPMSVFYQAMGLNYDVIFPHQTQSTSKSFLQNIKHLNELKNNEDTAVNMDSLVKALHYFFKSLTPSNEANSFEVIKKRIYLFMFLAKQAYEYDEALVKTKNRHLFKKMAFALLMIVGPLYAFCSGFDGAVAWLSMFGLSVNWLLVLGLAFGIIASIVFLGFDLKDKIQSNMTNTLQISDKVDAYAESLKCIRWFMTRAKQQQSTLIKGADIEPTLALWIYFMSVLVQLRSESDTLVTKKQMYLALFLKMVGTILAMVLFFGDGYFVGQLIFSLMLTSSMTSSTPLILGLSGVVGLLGAILYFLVQKKDVNRAIDRIIAADPKKLKEIKGIDDTDLKTCLYYINQLNGLKEKYDSNPTTYNDMMIRMTDSHHDIALIPFPPNDDKLKTTSIKNEQMVSSTPNPSFFKPFNDAYDNMQTMPWYMKVNSIFVTPKSI